MIDTYIKNMLSGDKRALAKLMSLVENCPERVPEVMQQLYPERKSKHKIGFSGPPGAGKSTLIYRVLQEFLKANLKVGVVCIDPSSPLSGGAILGDRVRMLDITLQNNVFIRSVASRDSTGGVAKSTKLHTGLLESFDVDLIIVETVGIGQLGYDIRKIVDTLVLVLVPEAGDIVQILKAGISELADIIVVNKADRAGASEMITTLHSYFEEIEDVNCRLQPADSTNNKQNNNQQYWKLPIIPTIAIASSEPKNDESNSMNRIDVLISEIRRHGEYIFAKQETSSNNRKNLLLKEFEEAVIDGFENFVKSKNFLEKKRFKKIIDSIDNGKIDPYTAAKIVLEQIFKNKGKG